MAIIPFNQNMPGINPNPTFGMPAPQTTAPGVVAGFDPAAQKRAALARGLIGLGAAIAGANRGQSLGQGLIGFSQGMDQGAEDYKKKWAEGLKMKQYQDQQTRDAQYPDMVAQADWLTPEQRQFFAKIDPATGTKILAEQAVAKPTESWTPMTPQDEISAFGKDLPGIYEKNTGAGGGYKLLEGSTPKDIKIEQITRNGIIESGYFAVPGDKNSWVSMGTTPQFKADTPPQPSDFQRKLNEVSKIYKPGTPEYNDAVLNITGAAKSQGMSITTNPDGTVSVDYGNKAPTDTQNVASGYYDRAQSADKELSTLLDKGYAPSLTDVAASGSGTIGNFALSDQAQQFYQAQRNFINAVLRKESGAVIGPSEFENAQKQYFPQPGDSDAVLKQKAENRRQAIESLKRSSGPAASMVTPPAGPPSDNDPLGIRGQQ